MSGFGARLKEARKAKGLTLDQLGEKVGSSKAYMWQLENKDAANISGELLIKLCEHLNKEPSYFLGIESGVADELAEKEILFRRFRSLEPKDRDRIRSIIELMNDKESQS